MRHNKTIVTTGIRAIYAVGIGAFLVLSIRNSMKALIGCHNQNGVGNVPPNGLSLNPPFDLIHTPTKATAAAAAAVAAAKEQPQPRLKGAAATTGADQASSTTERRDTESQQSDAAVQLPFNEEQGFGGCLMIMDDNHFLVEWLAYHWFALPLKHLIVMIDDKSRTSPMEIFKRWEGKIKIEVVDWKYPGVLAPVPENLMNETGVRHYLGRQHKFYEDCLKTYKLKMDWKSWLILIDTDEFYATSRFASLPQHKLYAGDGVRVAQANESESVMTRLKQINEQEIKAGENITDCFVTPRTQICLKTPKSAKLFASKLGMKNQDFLTQNYILADTRKNGKNVLNMGNIDRDYFEQLDLVRDGSAHIITPGRRCPEMQKFQIYHYAGSEEQRTFRDAIDPRGGYANRLGGSLNPTEEQCKGQKVSDIKLWMGGFIDKVGVVEAKRLLKGSGSVKNWPPFENVTGSIPKPMES